IPSAARDLIALSTRVPSAMRSLVVPPRDDRCWSVGGHRGGAGGGRAAVLARLVLGNPVAQDADVLDLGLDRVADLHKLGRLAGEAHAIRGARQDDVAGLEQRAS